MAAIALITNPTSHAVSQNGSVLARLSPDLPHSVHYMINSFAALPAQVHALINEGVHTFLIEGGDGTLQAILSAYFQMDTSARPDVQFAILPGGSTNLAHKVTGLKQSGADAIKALIDKLAENPFTARADTHRTLLLTATSSPQVQSGFVLSTGSLARAMIYTQENLHRSKNREWRSVARAVGRLAFVPKQARLDDGDPVITPSDFQIVNESVQTQAFSLFTTLPALSLNLKPFWNQGDNPIAFTSSSWPIQHLKTGVLKLLIGANGATMEKHGLTSHGIEALQFRCEGPIILDGEKLETSSEDIITLSASPALRFLR